MADILEVATREFAEKGLAGARIDEIAEAMRTSKRMIYYYFGSKEGLYIAVLEEAYRRMRRSRPNCTWKTWRPKTRCASWWASRSTTSWPPRLHPPGDDREHPPRRVPGAEQGDPAAQRAGHRRAAPCTSAAWQAGVFRSGIDPVDLHMSISALSGVQRGQPPHLRADLQARPGHPAGHHRPARQHHRDDRALRAQVAAPALTATLI
jgi:AcrR family transcriptional regulator